MGFNHLEKVVYIRSLRPLRRRSSPIRTKRGHAMRLKEVPAFHVVKATASQRGRSLKSMRERETNPTAVAT
jgi:hypothetical protein